MQTEGEVAGAAAAAAAGIPFALSTMGTTSIEDVAQAANPHGRNWFQLYMWKDRDRSMALVDRAAEGRVRHAARHGRRPGRRRAAARQAQRLHDPADPHPAHRPQRASRGRAWWFNFLTTEPLAFASLDRLVGHRRGAARRDVRPDRHLRGPGLDPGAVAGQGRGEGRADGRGRRRLADAASTRIAAVQPRRPPARPRPDPVPPAARRRARGRLATSRCTSTPGIMSGADIVAAVALGARFTLVGRAYLYGLMAGGRRGVDRAIEILRGPDRAHHAAARRHVPRRARARPRHPARAARAAPAPVLTPSPPRRPVLRRPRQGHEGRADVRLKSRNRVLDEGHAEPRGDPAPVGRRIGQDVFLYSIARDPPNATRGRC